MDDQKLDKMYEMTEKNNRMLHSMRRNAMLGGILKFAFWVILLVVIPYYTWLYVQPYVQGAQQAYQNVSGKAASADSTLTQIEKFLGQFGGNAPK